MSILVVGATGTVGRELVRVLHGAGEPVRAGARSLATAGRSFAPGVPVVGFDLTDPATWDEALRDVDRLFMIRPPQMVRVSEAEPFLRAAVQAGVGQVVLLSVQGAGRNPLLPHRAFERLVQSLPVRWTFLRPGYFMQNLLTVHRSEIVERNELSVPAGNGRTSFVDVRDVAEVAALALTTRTLDAQAPELTGASALTYAEVAATLSAVLARPIRYPHAGALRYLREQIALDRPVPLILITLALYSTARLGLAGRVSPDVQRLLGRPPTSLAEFVRDHAQHWSTHATPS